MGWLSGWTYRKKITLSRASGAVTNYQMKLLVGESSGASGEDVDCNGHVLSSFNDLRFTNSDGTTLLDYWIESITGTTPNQLATVWIEFDSIGTGATTFYMYYGKADATVVSNISNTFLFGDDFTGWAPQYICDGVNPVFAQITNGNVIVAYKNASSEIAMRVSTDLGITWGSETVITTGATLGQPHLANIGNTVFLIYATNIGGTNHDIHFKKSTDGGSSWGAEVDVVGTRFGDCDLVAIDTNNLLVATIQSDYNGIDIYSSSNGGTSWASLSNVIDSAANNLEDVELIILGNGNILCAYEQEVADLGKSYIKSKISANSGATWGSEITIWNAEDGNFDYELSGFFYNSDGNLVSVVYTNVDEALANNAYENYLTKHKVSTNHGATWGASATLIPDTRGLGPAGICYKLSNNTVLLGHSETWTSVMRNMVTKFGYDLTYSQIMMASSKWTTGNCKVYIERISSKNVARVEGYITGTTTYRAHAVSDYTGSDYAIRYRAKYQSPVVGMRFDFRYTDVDNHYMASFNAANGTFIYKDVSGTYTLLDQQNWGGVPDNTWAIVDLLLSGTSIKMYVDGTLRNDITDATYGSGKVALGAGNGTTSSPGIFDWFFVRQYLSTEPAWGSWGSENTGYEDSLTLASAAGIGNGSQAQFNPNLSLGAVSAISETSVASFLSMVALAGQAVTSQAVNSLYQDVLNLGAITSLSTSTILQAIGNLNLSGSATFTPSAMMELFSSLGLNASALLLFLGGKVYLDMVNLSADAKIDASVFIKRVAFEYEKLKLKVLSPGTEGSFSYERTKSQEISPVDGAWFDTPWFDDWFGLDEDFTYRRVT